MWLISTLFAAILATALWYALPKVYRLELLSLIFWGAAIMWLVDHVMAYLAEGGPFFDISSEGIVLALWIPIPALVVWEIVLLLTDPKGVLKSRRR